MSNKYKKSAFLYFLENRPTKTLIVIGLLFVSGLFEAIGIAAFLPFLQIFIDGKTEIESLPIGWLDNLVNEMGIKLNFLTISSFIISALIIKALALWLALRFVSDTVSQVAQNFRDTYLFNIFHSKWNFLTTHPLGESLNAISTESFRASQTFVSTAKLISAFLQVCIYTFSAFLLSWKASVGIISIGFVVVIILWGFVKMSRKAGETQTNTSKLLMSSVADIMQAIKPLRAMQIQKHFICKLQEVSESLKEAHHLQILSSQSLRIFHEPLLVISAIVGIYVALTYGDMSGSALIVMLVFFFRIMTGLNIAQSEYQRLVKEESALHSILRTLDNTKQQEEIFIGNQNTPKNFTNISFKNVSFSHENKIILKSKNLSFEAKTLTVLMGESGSGKTTILDLIMRFIEPDSGDILVDNINLKTINIDSWRSQLGFVPQDVFLFNGTIRDNILMGRQKFTDNDIWDSLKDAGAHEFVKSFSKGLDHMVGENGRRISGGQKQRIAIARSIIHKPSILILDEATSALDKQTEQGLFNTFKIISKDIMVIMVSHNQNVREYADNIINL